MVEKVTAAGDEVKAAGTGTQTVEKPAVAGTGGTGGSGASGGSDTAQGGGGSPSMVTDPLEHLRPHGTNMQDPDGHCIVCGKESGDEYVCRECHETPMEWNAKIDDFEKRARAAGWNDNQIRQGGEDFFRQVKAEMNELGEDSQYAGAVECAQQAQGYVSNPPAWLRTVR